VTIAENYHDRKNLKVFIQNFHAFECSITIVKPQLATRNVGPVKSILKQMHCGI